MVNPPTGYWNIYGAVFWAADIRDEHHSTPEGRRAGPFGGANIGKDAARVTQDALECGELRAAGVRAADGVLVTIPPSAWRVVFARPNDPRSVVGYSERWNHDLHGPPQATRIPFAEAREGRTFPLLRHGVTPILAQADLFRWAGAEPPAEPPERQDDWPVSVPAPAGMTPADAARFWLNGYATKAAEGSSVPKRDDKAMIQACKAATGCTVDDVRAAYTALPETLRNASPKERQIGKKRAAG